MSDIQPGSQNKSDDEWRAVLNKEQVRGLCLHVRLMSLDRDFAQFRILRQKGTEAAGTGKYDKHYEEGVYTCAGCGTPLYKSTTKFKSGCGWPAFFDGKRLEAASEIGVITSAPQPSQEQCLDTTIPPSV